MLTINFDYKSFYINLQYKSVNFSTHFLKFIVINVANCKYLKSNKNINSVAKIRINK
jgi:hypothetical protein